jgi:hypothetical protein
MRVKETGEANRQCARDWEDAIVVVAVPGGLPAPTFPDREASTMLAGRHAAAVPVPVSMGILSDDPQGLSDGTPATAGRTSGR